MTKESIFSGFAKRFGLGSGTTPDRLGEAGIKDWLVQRLARHLKVDASEIDPAKPFEAYGLDSRMAVRVAGELEKVVERRLSPALLFEHPAIDELASFLANETAQATTQVTADASDASGLPVTAEVKA
jgi:acyl carrier protein